MGRARRKTRGAEMRVVIVLVEALVLFEREVRRLLLPAERAQHDDVDVTLVDEFAQRLSCALVAVGARLVQPLELQLIVLHQFTEAHLLFEMVGCQVCGDLLSLPRRRRNVEDAQLRDFLVR